MRDATLGWWPPPLSLRLLRWSPPAVQVRWRFHAPLNVHLHHFQVIYQAVRDRIPSVQFTSNEKRSAILDGLQPQVEYSVRVLACVFPLPGGGVASAAPPPQARFPVNSAGPDYETHLASNQTAAEATYLSIGFVGFIAPGSANGSSSSSSGSGGKEAAGMSSREATNNPVRSLVVRDEEIVIVVLVLTVWVAVLLLFFNKWGKIRMLEPYQPQYQREPQFSRASSLGAPPILVKGDLQRLSSVASGHYYATAATGPAPQSRSHRARQNSVFVGSQLLIAAPQSLSRRTKSAEDIKSLVVQVEHQASTQSTAL